MGVWVYDYNAAGELIYKKDANDVVSSYRYDVLGRKTYQKEGGSAASTWIFDARGKTSLGAVTSMSGGGSKTDYYYNGSGLLAEKATYINSEKFSTSYYYNDQERIMREVRPNDQDSSNRTPTNLSSTSNPENRFALDYKYNTFGYLALIQSPKTYADKAFASASYRDDIQKLIKETLDIAKQYLVKAERYAKQKSFFEQKSTEYNAKTIGLHHLDSASIQSLLSNNYQRFKRWCDDQSSCYLRPATWVLLHDDVTIPLDITLDGAIYQLQQKLASSEPGVRNYNSSVIDTGMKEAAIQQMGLKASGDFFALDYNKDGKLNLIASNDAYAARADSSTQTELIFSAEELQQAAEISGKHYRYYTDLAADLISLSQKVMVLSGIYCEAADTLVGDSNKVTSAERAQCESSDKPNSLKHLESIFSNSELAEAGNDAANQIYWQRRETDAYGHTLSETLGNGLVNTYHHSASTGRPLLVATHKTGQVLSSKYREVTGKTHSLVNSNKALRWLEYRYDVHNNVTWRYDQNLGIGGRE